MDRNEAIELLKNMHWSITTKMNREVPSSLALLMAIKALDKDIDVPSKWIPVSERLPEEGQGCLVCDKGQILIDTFIGHGNPYNWRWYVRDYEAWMPLPEPYKEGEENGNVN